MDYDRTVDPDVVAWREEQEKIAAAEAKAAAGGKEGGKDGEKKEEKKKSLAQVRNDDIKPTRHINEDVVIFTRPLIDPMPEFKRPASPPTGAMVKGWDSLHQR